MNKRPYILLMMLLASIYTAGRCLFTDSIYTEIVTTVLAIIAAVAFWMAFHSNERINEAQVIMELNNQFVTNERFSDVEWALEKYYAAYMDAKKNGTDPKEIKLDLKIALEDRMRQDLVNYLVHLEGVAVLVNEGVLHLDVITDCGYHLN